MVEQISEATAAFLAEVMPVVVGTRRRDGRVKMNPAWYEYRDGHFWLNSWRGARWLEHLERDGLASLLLIAPDDMHKVVHAETELVCSTEDGAGAHIDRLSQRYRGVPYRAPVPQRRVMLQLRPLSIRSTLDNAARPAWGAR
ncbi:pyridoxamine 5'-phosphate oxidase family protein [Dactylosporangium vinaceum]|uniref:Pyridoxamine 5'-phosphate oxidase family protein n=1 Tax=Dactylosporangium vinaceum TaxID=53362 RepID=A0ABV5MKP7_9ACTN|nr:pyridoxamine 5'-phosphate oxidase family protein [Dactylosporangium vinaceum]UAB93906.1 pyridoxamine 5'-phosphate oxidase family protein [Dactylosporangium vinaceum]